MLYAQEVEAQSIKTRAIDEAALVVFGGTGSVSGFEGSGFCELQCLASFAPERFA